MRFGTATEAFEALPEIAGRAARCRRIELTSTARIEDETAETDKLGARLAVGCEAAFPKLLRALDPPPPILTMLGNPE